MSDHEAGLRAVKEPPRPKPRRVYKTVSVDGPPYRVLLDGKALSSPLRRPLTPPTRALAEAIAAEWDAQKEHVDPETMPVMRMMSTYIDKVADGRDELVAAMMSHADADLICYRASHPADLKKRQDAVWQPVLNWLAGKHGIELQSSEGLMPFEQSRAAKDALQRAFAGLPALTFTAAQAVAGITGSLGLALAMAGGHLSAAETFAASQLDESYQRERWGDDPLAKARRDAIAAELAGIEKFLKLSAEAA